MTLVQALITAISVLASAVGLLFGLLIAKYRENATFRKPLEDAHSAELAKRRDEHSEEIAKLRERHEEELAAARKECKAERDALATVIMTVQSARLDDAKSVSDRLLQSMETQTKATQQTISALDGNKQALVGLSTLVKELGDERARPGGPRK